MPDRRIARAALCARFAGTVLLSLVAAAGCDRQQPRPVRDEGEATFVGSEVCADCHRQASVAWRGSHHARAMQVAGTETVLGDFNDVEFRHFAAQTRFSRSTDRFVVTTDGADGRLADFPVLFTFGVEPLQQYLVETAGGHLQALPFAWDTRPAQSGGQRWFHLYAEEPIPAGSPLHWSGREQNWNYMCAECHVTDFAKNYDMASDRFASEWSEIGVGCEACHGPGSSHAQQAARISAGGAGLLVDLDDAGRAVWEMNPATGIASRSEIRMRPPAQPEACGRCHARRGVIAAAYEWGRPLIDTHLPALLEDPLYFADGQIREEVYVYGSFVQSRMYQAGVSCTDCHDPHTAGLRSGPQPSAVCTTCHLPAVFDAPGHHRHPEGAAACVDCHMPERVYMGVDARRDHGFRVPDPLLASRIGAPDACTGCHGQSAAERIEEAYENWFGTGRDGQFGLALHAGRSGSGTDALVEAIRDPVMPGIARGTALTLLPAPFGSAVAAVVREAAGNPDPFVRLGALRAAARMQPQQTVEVAAQLVGDALRGIRVEAARVLSPYRDRLPAAIQPAFERADSEWQAASLAIAERPEARVTMAGRAVDMGDFERAEALLESTLQLDPDFVAAIGNLADLYRLQAKDADAERLLRAALDRNPETASLRHALGLLLVRTGQADDSLTELALAARLEPGNARYVYVHGVALNSLGRADEAADLLSGAAARFPGDYEIGWALATILRDQGRTEEARHAAETLGSAFPEDVAVRRLIESF